ncbi:SLC13 family permease [Aeoliella sp. SH292]|uniref:SLC13 family permease n=1 Tax=Aeoliella sp. SH292 TaxID=3454464 RepID=UPI003F9CBBE0
MGMTGEGWLTIGVLVVTFIGLLRNVAPPDMLFILAVSVLALFGVITPTEAFSGFSNAGMLTVAFLFVVASGLRETGVLNYVGGRLLGGATTSHQVIARLSAMVIPASAFLNNTPIVAMLMPVVLDWSRRTRVSPSKLLIPLSYLAILGGTCTLIGTSTNLVVHGLMLKSGIPGIDKGMTLFELAPVGVPYAIIGVGFLLLFGDKLLPNRTELFEKLGKSRKEYIVEMQVDPQSKLVGKTVEAAGLRHLHGLYLIEIQRESEVVSPAGPDEVLQGRDELVFAGEVESVVELQNLTGLIPVAAAEADESASIAELARRRMAEIVISVNSRLVGQTIRDADIRATYGAVVIAVHRDGSRVEGKIGDVRLESGDTLLLQTPPHFARAYRNDPAFYIVSDVNEFRPFRRHRAWIAVPLLGVLIVLMSTGWIDSVVASALVASAMVFAGCISAGEARRSIEWQVLVTIAAAFGVGIAMEKSGVASAAAEGLVAVTGNMGPVFALAAIYILVSLLTEMVTNNAIAILMFPVCLQVASQLNVDPRPFLIALTLAASASFMTPIGYQTNLMVYGPGGYQFGDYLKIGAPLNFILGLVAVVLIPYFWPFVTQ